MGHQEPHFSEKYVFKISLFDTWTEYSNAGIGALFFTNLCANLLFPNWLHVRLTKWRFYLNIKTPTFIVTGISATVKVNVQFAQASTIPLHYTTIYHGATEGI